MAVNKMFFGAIAMGVVLLTVSMASASVLRCDLIDPQSRESVLCWKQLLYKNYPKMPQIIQEETPDAPIPIHARNAELSSALMQLYGFNKPNGKRNPDFSSDLMRYINDINTYNTN